MLGGIISPPNAVAASSVLRSVSIPKRITTILEGESLINDASSLIVFRFALAAILSGTFVWQGTAADFVLVAVIGIVTGLAVGGVFYIIHRWLPAVPRATILLTFITLTPYIMYLTAEQFHFSGVMAVVSGGLFLSNHRHKLLNHATRIQGTAMWSTVIFALNGIVFILIGLKLPVIINGHGDYSKAEAIWYAVLVTLFVITTRIGVTFFTVLFTRIIGRVVYVADRNPGWRGPLVVGWAGMRGVVSLASALSIPLTLSNGQPFPHRNLILFITFVVILGTLVFQGLTLPLLVRWLKLKDPDNRMPEEEQESMIRLKIMKLALNELEEKYALDVINNELVGNLKNRIESDMYLTEQHLDSLESNGEQVVQYNQILTSIISVKRNELHRLRNKQEFDDEVIRKEETRLDLEEEKIDHPIH